MSLRMNLIALGFVLAAPALAAPFGGNGTNILHLSLRTDFASPDAPDAVAGSLSAKLRQQGHADVQKVKLEVSGLTADTEYFLFAVLDDASEVEMASFQTDENGEASLKLMHIGHKDVAGKKFPVGLESLADVETLEVRDGIEVDAGVALTADLSEPDQLKYLVKRRLTPSGVDDDAAGSLFMKESGEKVQFRLRAGNLDATDYTLAIFAGMAETTFPVAAEDGEIDLKELPDGAPMPFQMTRIELRLGPDVVLSTDLP
jgi:hypothetical protein